MADWCEVHPKYSAKREPNSVCGKCWSLWLLRCPERKGEDRMIAQEMKEEDTCRK